MLDTIQQSQPNVGWGVVPLLEIGSDHSMMVPLVGSQHSPCLYPFITIGTLFFKLSLLINLIVVTRSFFRCVNIPFKLQFHSTVLEGIFCLFFVLFCLFLLPLPISALVSEGTLTFFVFRFLGPPTCILQSL